MRFCLAAYTDKGKTRKVNQDGLLLQQAVRGRERYVLAAVCDGMGGLNKGELASSEVLGGLAAWFRRELPALMSSRDPEGELLGSWEQLVQLENERLYRYGKEQGLKLGTTLTAALFAGDSWYSVHAGDSRLYEITDRTEQLTRDHSLAAEAVEQGILTREEGERDRRRSILTRCIGAGPEVKPEYRRGSLRQDAVYLLCSDGFWHGKEKGQLTEAFPPGKLTREKQLQRAAARQAAESRKKGETDNISALLVRPLPERGKKRGKRC